MDYLSNIYNLKFIIRYSNVERIRDESVAEHSFFVASLVLELANEYKFNIGKALQMAIVHDYPEVYVDDVSQEVKRNFPKIRESLKNAEKEAIKNFSKSVQKAYNEYELFDSIEAKIVKLADILSVLQYCKSEINLGNNGYISDVYSKTYKLQNKFREILKEYKK